ncbi:ATP/GTP-binding protein [Promicromonospora sp. NPDC019610]|uniref:ATP/GTP-binding protein n=1 Tax=Promicromonospora sp. NPDC019610 TaxID=3364405 RepID=UPI0037A8B40A
MRIPGRLGLTLIRFEAKNFRSIAAPVTLSLVAIDQDREAARPAERLGESLLTRAAIYGPNASGKSNLLVALIWLRDAVTDSLHAWDDQIPVDPFAFGEGGETTTEFVLDLLVGGVRFEYVLGLDAERVHYEALHHYPERRRRTLFEREAEELSLHRTLGSPAGTRELLTPTSLAVTILSRLRVDPVQSFVDCLASFEAAGMERVVRRTLAPGRYLRALFDDAMPGPDPRIAAHERARQREQARSLLRMADLGIRDVAVVDVRNPMLDLRSMTEALLYGPEQADRAVQLIHDDGGTGRPLPFHEESAGTQTWYSAIGTVLPALHSGSPVVFDELDASLHPTLAAHLLRIFADPAINPKGAQLIFSSHDTSLLAHLNRDEVWLTEKRKDGSTRLGALSDFAGERVRSSVKLESAYLHGKFGALPDVDQAEFLRSLGLIG